MATRILVVDDDAAAADTLCGRLRDRGFDAVFAVDGVQAQVIARDRPQLFILDYNLPVADGAKVLEWFRRQLHLRDTPAIFITGYEPDHVAKALRGQKRVLFHRKPVEMETLEAQIRELLALDEHSPLG